ncbi:hypothetical protein [Lysobacter sp. A3-1-A15]|uniref:hypothetical protein n=1 Tax=Novilysobacter viscosus TaxID=3098602 RepID=UPI002EDAB9DF
MNRSAIPLRAALLASAIALAACQPATDPAQAEAARIQAAEADADAMADQFEAAFAEKNWAMARAHGDVLLAEHPGSAAADRIRERHQQATADAKQEREDRRLQSLWIYQTQPVDGGEQRSAAIYARDRVDVDGSGERPVRLIFRDHPDWGRSSYLVLETGDFDCYGGCRVQVTVDDAQPRAMAASRPKTDEAIAMFIDDEAALWRIANGAATVAIEFPVKAGGTRTALFEVGGLDSMRMPGWE